MKNLGNRVRAFRRDRDWNLDVLAKRSGVSKGLLSRMENDANYNPTLETVFSVAEAFEVTIADLLGEPTMAPQKITPNRDPIWLKDLRKNLSKRQESLDNDVVQALYVLQNRKGQQDRTSEDWIFLYRSIQNSLALHRRPNP